MKTFIANIDWLEKAEIIRKNLRTYITDYNLKSLVLGISGGIDSALTAALAEPVCRELDIPLIGRSLVIEGNKPEEIRRAKNIGANFCTDFRERDLTIMYQIMKDTIEEESYSEITHADKVRRGNIKARIRMIYLYNLASKYKGLVLSTDNRTEFMLGFWTLHGDVGDYNPLFGLWKTEVFALADALAASMEDRKKREALQYCVEAIPTDGLGITNSDVEQLNAANYEEVDTTLAAYIHKGDKSGNPTVIERHIKSAFKRENPYVISRSMLGLEERDN
ncbi:MAG: NAD(+) synthase [Odoribacter sp.]|nr:NAD(+) synthase [Odoribacter sp.]